MQRIGEPKELIDALLYAGGEEGGPPIRTKKAHVLHRGPLDNVKFSTILNFIVHLFYFCYI